MRKAGATSTAHRWEAPSRKVGLRKLEDRHPSVAGDRSSTARRWSEHWPKGDEQSCSHTSSSPRLWVEFRMRTHYAMTWIETAEAKAGAFTARFQKYGVANRLEKRSLLIAVNAVASLSIFFFGYGTCGASVCSHCHANFPCRPRCDGRCEHRTKLCLPHGLWPLRRSRRVGTGRQAAPSRRHREHQRTWTLTSKMTLTSSSGRCLLSTGNSRWRPLGRLAR